MDTEKVFAVFGLGVFGLEICRVLASKGANVIAVDKDQKMIDRIKDTVTYSVLLDSTDEEALRNAGLDDVDVAVIAVGDTMDASILTTILLKNMGVPRIIARARSDVHGQVLKRIGATEVINIEIEVGHRLANRIFSPDIIDVIPLSPDATIAELKLPKDFAGKSPHELDVRKKYNVNIVAVKRTKTDVDALGNPKRAEQVFTPKPTDILKVNDLLVILGRDEDIEKLKEIAK